MNEHPWIKKGAVDLFFSFYFKSFVEKIQSFTGSTRPSLHGKTTLGVTVQYGSSFFH